MELLNCEELIIKKSRFIGLYYFVSTIDEVTNILTILKKEHKKARHFPYAYKLGNLEKKNDDKEPFNTAGNPIYNIIVKNSLDNVLIVVIRYYGGVKLGAGGLARAYGAAARMATKNQIS